MRNGLIADRGWCGNSVQAYLIARRTRTIHHCPGSFGRGNFQRSSRFRSDDLGVDSVRFDLDIEFLRGALDALLDRLGLVLVVLRRVVFTAHTCNPKPLSDSASGPVIP